MLIKRKYLFGTTILAGVMAVSAPAFAQQLPGVTVQGQSDQEATEIGEVVVTGSRIRRDPTNAPTPLIQVSGEQLLATGQSTVIDYLATIPALSNSVVPSDTTGSNLNDGGLSLANLRSLGSNRTLTLIDGRRQVGSSGGSLAVDIDTVPRLLIENVEIITGGASSVYGADAVSGVLNFVLRKDFEGLEIDANYGMINQGGQANQRISVLAGANLLDDRLNVWTFGEYDKNDIVQMLDIDWYEDAWGTFGADADPTAIGNGPAIDGVFDNAGPVSDRRTLQILRWGQVTLANNQPASPLNDPDVPFANCPAAITFNNLLAANCYNIAPGKTWIFEGLNARLADFGTRIGATGTNRTINIGGDGENPSAFGQITRVPESESKRFAAGMNFAITPNITLASDIKYVFEETFDISQPAFFDAYISPFFLSPTSVDNGLASSAFLLSTDTAYLPANLRAAILANQLQQYSSPTVTTPGLPTTSSNVPHARYSAFVNDRSQYNTRELMRGVISLDGRYDNLGFINNFNWNISYNYGQVEVENVEQGLDYQRFQLAADAVVDTAGVVNGRPGEIVCKARLLAAQGTPLTQRDPVTGNIVVEGLLDSFRNYRAGGFQDLRSTPQGAAAVANCQPLNIFGKGNQSQAALDYIDANISPTERNEQEQAIAYISGEVGDPFGAGPIGMAIGVEYRREFTEGVGRTADTAGRLLFLNTGADFPATEYETKEAFAEVSIPLFRDSWLGEYAEISGSYRHFDYTTVGKGDVYGVNLVYRPIPDITFKTSFNTSFRAPDLGEQFGPLNQTFANGLVDPCDTRQISGIANTELKQYRITNCTALFARIRAERGLAAGSDVFDFAGATATPTDDYNPTYPSGIPGLAGGNPDLTPEESESLTISAVIQPRFFPNLSVVLDYYEIELDNVIVGGNAIGAGGTATQCVGGPELNEVACARIFRQNTPVAGATAEQRSQAYEIGNPATQVGFISTALNFAKLQTRGLDFTGRYRLDTEEMFGRNFGRFDYSIRGLWLIEQKSFTNIANPTAFTEASSTQNFPRVRFTSELTWTPNDVWSATWTADWQTAQDIVNIRDQVNNVDNRPYDWFNTGNFTRHDFYVRYNVSDELTLRAGVTNAFDAEQPRILGSGLLDNFDPYGTRFNIGLNWRPY
jgi:outer membrane receptor protein involved in Fe transport